MNREIVYCKDVFKKDKFDKYAQFVFSVGLAREFARRGALWSVKGMKIDFDKLPMPETDLFWWSVKEGFIVDFSEEAMERAIVSSEPDDWIDLDWVSSVGNEIFFEKDGGLVWTEEWAREHYPNENHSEMKLFNFGNGMKYTLIGVLSKYFADLLIGKEERKLTLYLSGFTAKNRAVVLWLESCRRSLSWFSKYVTIEREESGSTVDWGYSLFFNEVVMTNQHHLYTIQEKKKFLQDMGMIEGSIAILWERKGMCESNPAGRIDGAHIVRVEKILDKELVVTDIAVSKTLAELRVDWENTLPSVRGLWEDMTSLYERQRNLPYYSIGVGEHFSNVEDLLLCKIDKGEMVSKFVRVDGELKEIQMSQEDAIFLILKEFGVSFNEDWFRKEYFADAQPIYDLLYLQ